MKPATLITDHSHHLPPRSYLGGSRLAASLDGYVLVLDMFRELRGGAKPAGTATTGGGVRLLVTGHVLHMVLLKREPLVADVALVEKGYDHGRGRQRYLLWNKKKTVRQ